MAGFYQIPAIAGECQVDVVDLGLVRWRRTAGMAIALIAYHVGIGQPLCVERVVGCIGDHGGRSDLSAPAGGCEPATEGIIRAAAGGQGTVGGTKGDGCARRTGGGAVVAVEGDGVAIGRPLGVEREGPVDSVEGSRRVMGAGSA